MKFYLLCLSLIFFLISPKAVLAIECDDNVPKGNIDLLIEYQKKCQEKINALQNQQNTLKAAIGVINSKINLTQGQINQTSAQIESLEKDINTLSQVVNSLSLSRDELEVVYQAKVREVYKNKSPDPLVLFLSSNNFASFYTKLKYLKVTRTRDQFILQELEKARDTYDQQKQLKEQKQAEVEALKQKLITQKASLASQQEQKQILLTQTRNDEKKFQELLSQARAELEAIEAVIAGKGEEQEVRDVSTNEVIAKVINSSSCNSTGSHLHFIVAQDSAVQNPFNYLKKEIDYQNCSGSGCDSDNSDPFNPNGSWDWPLNPRIKLTQGYGNTWAVNNTWVRNIYQFHNGIDLYSDSLDVKAVQPGKLYRGSYTGSGGCTLKYVRVHHQSDNFDTYYLHVNYF